MTGAEGNTITNQLYTEYFGTEKIASGIVSLHVPGWAGCSFQLSIRVSQLAFQLIVDAQGKLLDTLQAVNQTQLAGGDPKQLLLIQGLDKHNNISYAMIILIQSVFTFTVNTAFTENMHENMHENTDFTKRHSLLSKRDVSCTFYCMGLYIHVTTFMQCKIYSMYRLLLPLNVLFVENTAFSLLFDIQKITWSRYILKGGGVRNYI